MVLRPMIRANICMNAHPVGLGVEAQKQIDYVRSRGRLAGPRRALVIGGSAGYGLSSRIAAAFGSGAATLNVALERPATERRTATVGWYNTDYVERRAREAGLTAVSILGDAFSAEVKDQAVAVLREWGPVDLVVYSLASPVRVDPSGTEYRSVLKPVGEPFTARTIDMMSGEFSWVTLEPATEDEIAATVKVMGGEDWQLWIERLLAEGLLAEGTRTVAYSYVGPRLIGRIYREGSIGRAKEHLEATAKRLTESLEPVSGAAYVSVNKAVVTRASSVISGVPLYGITLFRVMKDKGLHEGTIEQIHRLFSERLYTGGPVPVDAEGRIRIDDWEMRDDVQAEVARIMESVNETNVRSLTDFDAYRREFLRIHGFEVDGVDYEADVEP